MCGIRMRGRLSLAVFALAVGPGCSLALFGDEPVDGAGDAEDGGAEVDVGPDAEDIPDVGPDVDVSDDGTDGEADGDVPSECGNGVVEEGEDCDDGNTT
ncbi:MAG: hypothetical protein JXB32_04725, partial [Deltaproteobacteria bacterium]|nr:hypothetical protein [Deltaproteobacteria bacterium]